MDCFFHLFRHQNAYGTSSVAMSRSHKLITLDSNTTHKIVSNEEDSSQIFMLDDMQFGGGFGRYLG